MIPLSLSFSGKIIVQLGKYLMPQAPTEAHLDGTYLLRRKFSKFLNVILIERLGVQNSNEFSYFEG